MAKDEGKKVDGVRSLPSIARDRLQLREAAQNDWQCFAPHGVTLEDLEDGRLWSTVAQQLRAYDVIRVVGPEQTWWAEVLVKFATSGRAIVKTIRTVQLGARILADDLGVPPGHRIEQGSPGEGWVIFRDVDGVVMAKGCDNGNWSRQQALAWLLNHASLRESLPAGAAPRG